MGWAVFNNYVNSVCQSSVIDFTYTESIAYYTVTTPPFHESLAVGRPRDGLGRSPKGNRRHPTGEATIMKKTLLAASAAHAGRPHRPPGFLSGRAQALRRLLIARYMTLETMAGLSDDPRRRVAI
jgi:hypothetical protein